MRVVCLAGVLSPVENSWPVHCIYIVPFAARPMDPHKPIIKQNPLVDVDGLLVVRTQVMYTGE